MKKSWKPVCFSIAAVMISLTTSCAIYDELSDKDKAELPGAILKWLFTPWDGSSTVEDLPNLLGDVFHTLIWLPFLAGLVLAIYLFFREKKERLKHFTPEMIRATASNPAPDANAKAREICNELEHCPPIKDQLVARLFRLRILDAVKLGPDDPDVLRRLNNLIDTLNAATERRFTFPGVTTETKSCWVLFVLVYLAVMFTLRTLLAGLPPILFLPILTFYLGGLVLSSLTPAYLVRTMHETFVFRMMTSLYAFVGRYMKIIYNEAQKPYLVEVKRPYESKKYYWAEPSCFAVLVILSIGLIVIFIPAVFIATLIIPVSLFYSCRNYLFTSADTENYLEHPSVQGISSREMTSKDMFRMIAIAIGIAMGIGFLLSGFMFSAPAGLFFWLLPLLYVPEFFQSHVNSRIAAAIAFPTPERIQKLRQTYDRKNKYSSRILIACFCVIGFMTFMAIHEERYQVANKKFHEENRHKGENSAVENGNANAGRMNETKEWERAFAALKRDFEY